MYYDDKKQLILEFGSDAYSPKGLPFPPKEGFAVPLEKTKQIIESHKWLIDSS